MRFRKSKSAASRSSSSSSAAAADGAADDHDHPSAVLRGSSALRRTTELLQHVMEPAVGIRGFGAGQVGQRVDAVCARLFPAAFTLVGSKLCTFIHV